MGNNMLAPTQKKKTVCSCLAPAILDRDELAIHKEVGVPKGRLSIEAMKFLNQKERSLMMAAANSSSELIQKLIKSGAPPDTYDENRTSPLHIACRQGSLSVVKELLDHRASIDITDCAGWTSLHIAAFSCRPEIVKLLLQYSADATIINRNGETPWDLATDQETQQEFIKYWKQKSEDAESPHVPSIPKTLYDITAKKAFPRSSSPILQKIKNVKKWAKIGEYPTMPLAEGPEAFQEIALKIFNNNPYKGLAVLILFEIIKQDQAKIAEFLLESSVSPLKLSSLLADTDLYYSQILEEFMKKIPFAKSNLVNSLRKLLKIISLPKDIHQANHVIKCFAKTYWNINTQFKSSGSIENLALSAIMLDFSLHENISTPISKADFITSTAGMHNGEDFSEKYLSWLYDEIKRQSLRVSFQPPEEKTLFKDEKYSDHLAYKGSRDWKERFFILKQNIFWSFSSSTALTPYSLLPVSGLAVHFDTRLQIFTITSVLPFIHIKFSDTGLVYVHKPSRLYFKAGNLKMWMDGFQEIPGIKLTIV